METSRANDEAIADLRAQLERPQGSTTQVPSSPEVQVSHDAGLATPYYPGEDGRTLRLLSQVQRFHNPELAAAEVRDGVPGSSLHETMVTIGSAPPRLYGPAGPEIETIFLDHYHTRDVGMMTCDHYGSNPNGGINPTNKKRSRFWHQSQGFIRADEISTFQEQRRVRLSREEQCRRVNDDRPFGTLYRQSHDGHNAPVGIPALVRNHREGVPQSTDDDKVYV